MNAGAEIAGTFLIDRAQAHIRAVTAPLGCELPLPCDVRIPRQLKAVFDRVTAEWGRLNFMLQAIAGSASTCMRKGQSA